MHVTVNGRGIDTEARNLKQLVEETLTSLGAALTAQRVAAAVGTSIIPRSQWHQTPLHEGDAVVIIKAACGG